MTRDGANVVEPRAIRVMIVDDDAMVRTLLTRILKSAGIEVVAEAEDGDRAVESARAYRPDVVLMDIRMARMSGITATMELRKLQQAPGVIALTSYGSNRTVLDAVEAGVAAFLEKSCSPEEVIQAVRVVAAGDSLLSPAAARAVIDELREGARSGQRIHAEKVLSQLSARERELVGLLSHGVSNAEIAQKLHLSEATVKTHLASAMTKTGVENRVQLAVLASQAGESAAI